MVNNNSNSIFFEILKSREIRILILVGLLYRLVGFTFFYSNITLTPDSEGYIYLAKRLLNFNLADYNGERTIGYPILIFLALGSLKLTVFYQFLIGIATSVFWYKTILNFNFSTRKSLCIALFLESFLNIYFYETAILTDTFTLFFISVVFFQISKGYLDKRSLKLEIFMSFVFGFLVLIKPFFVFLPFVFFGFYVIKDFKISHFYNQKIIILIIPLFAYFGWSYVNKINTGYFVPTTFIGLNMAQNCVYFAEKGPEKYHWIITPYVKHREIAIKEKTEVAMAIWSAYESGEYNYRHLNFADFSNQLGLYAKETIENNPKEYAKQVVFRSWFDFWKTTIQYNQDKFNSENANTLFEGIWYMQRKLFNIFKFGFLLLIPFYSYRFLKTKKITQELIMVTVVFITSILQGLATYGTNSKNSFPFEYLMIIVVLLFIKNQMKRPRFLNTFLQ